MSLINAGAFTGVISQYRMLWILGKYGGHKTSLAYKLAQPYLEKGYRLVTNNQCAWSDDLEDVKLDKDGHLKVIIILDEGGTEFKANRQIEQIAAYSNKMDMIFIIPSYFPPARNFQVLTCQSLYSLVSAGIPAVVYKWRAKLGGFEDSGHFIWWYPKEIYGVYSRQDPGARSSKIVDWLIRRKDEYRSRWGHGEENEVSGMENNTATEFDILSDAVEGLSEAADTMASIPVRKSRRWKF